MSATVKDTNNSEELLKELKKLKKSTITVGVIAPDSELEMKAKVNEYGATIPVTDKMRGWFAANGYPLKKETKKIVIPERSFVRSGFDENVDGVYAKMRDLIGDVLSLEINADIFANMIGLEMSGKIQKQLRDLRSPANSKMTVDKKGSSNPLIDSGQLVGSIRHEVE